MNGATVKVYSLAKDGNKKLSKNFAVKEFACEDGSDVVFISDGLVQVLQAIRSHFGRKAIVHSGYRTVAYNKKLKNASPNSQHMYGLACDFHVDGVAHKTVAAYAEKLLPGTGVGQQHGTGKIFQTEIIYAHDIEVFRNKDIHVQFHFFSGAERTVGKSGKFSVRLSLSGITVQLALRRYLHRQLPGCSLAGSSAQPDGGNDQFSSFQGGKLPDVFLGHLPDTVAYAHHGTL